MRKEDYTKANSIQAEIDGLKRWVDKIEYCRKNHNPLFWRCGQAGDGQISNSELNHKITDLIVEFVNEKIPLLQKQFDEV